MPKLTCDTCAHWDRAKPTGGDPAPDKGDCTRYPPTATPIFAEHPITRQPVLRMVASVYPSLPVGFKACGEYDERPSRDEAYDDPRM
jgi:hypothetical protein